MGSRISVSSILECGSWFQRIPAKGGIPIVIFELTDLGWGKARKRPVVIYFREPIHTTELITTLEGELRAKKGEHFVIMGVNGELYPIDKEIFEKTYDILQPCTQEAKENV